jgi:GTP-binding protein
MPELLKKVGALISEDVQRPTSNVQHPTLNEEKVWPGRFGESPLPQIKIAIIGRPNAGKSSLINAVLRDRRTIVSEMPGTTRDAIDVEYERDGKRYLFIDTAGIRHRSRHSSSAEVFSVMRAEKTIARAEICVLVVDAAEGVKAQDRRVAASIQKARKACLIVMNKWDLVRKLVIPSKVEGSGRVSFKVTSTGSLGSARDDRKAIENAIANARAELFFIDYAPVLVTSALTGEHADRIFKMIERVRRAATRHIGTGKLNRVLRAAFAANPPPMVKGKRLKLFYATQSSGNESRPVTPPEFILFVNSARLLTQPYARFLEAKIREIEAYPGLPILLKARARSEG